MYKIIAEVKAYEDMPPVLVCVCVCVWERQRQRQKERLRNLNR